MVPKGPKWSSKLPKLNRMDGLYNQVLKSHPNGSGITRSPGLVWHPSLIGWITILFRQRKMHQCCRRATIPIGITKTCPLILADRSLNFGRYIWQLNIGITLNFATRSGNWSNNYWKVIHSHDKRQFKKKQIYPCRPFLPYCWWPSYTFFVIVVLGLKVMTQREYNLTTYQHTSDPSWQNPIPSGSSLAPAFNHMTHSDII